MLRRIGLAWLVNRRRGRQGRRKRMHAEARRALARLPKHRLAQGQTGPTVAAGKQQFLGAGRATLGGVEKKKRKKDERANETAAKRKQKIRAGTNRKKETENQGAPKPIAAIPMGRCARPLRANRRGAKNGSRQARRPESEKAQRNGLGKTRRRFAARVFRAEPGERLREKRKKRRKKRQGGPSGRRGKAQPSRALNHSGDFPHPHRGGFGTDVVCARPPFAHPWRP